VYLKIGVEKELLDDQVKVIELDERLETRHEEEFVGDEIKQRKWTTTAVKEGQF